MQSQLELARPLLNRQSDTPSEEDTMRNRYFWPTLLLLMAGLFLVGCDDEVDHTPPGVPRGVASITGDGEVTITWLGSTEPDLSTYIIYREDRDPDDFYEEIGRIDVRDFLSEYLFTDDFVQNGETYYYAISAVDFDGNESDLSYEDVHDTPRPEGHNVFIDPTADEAGFYFAAHARVSRHSANADIVFTFDESLNAFFIEAASSDVDLQDFGYTGSMNDLDWAPQDGWSGVGWSEVISGHTYVIWTGDDHYAKLRITDSGESYVRFDWAWQSDPGNPELKRAADSLIAQHQ